MQEIEISSRIDMLAGLSPEETARFVETCRVLQLARGERVFGEGDPGDDLFIVRRGRIRITKSISPDVMRTLALIGEGGVFGELVIVDAGARSATAEADEPSEVLALGREAFQRLVGDHPALGIKILGRLAASLAERLRFTNDLLREALSWGLEVSGAASLNLGKVLRRTADIRLTIVTGREVTGRLLKVDRSQSGFEIMVKDRDERIHMVPYHAIAAIEFPRETLAAVGTQEV